MNRLIQTYLGRKRKTKLVTLLIEFLCCCAAKISVEREPVSQSWLVHKSCANGAIKAVVKHTWLNLKLHSSLLLNLCAEDNAKDASVCSAWRVKK